MIQSAAPDASSTLGNGARVLESGSAGVVVTRGAGLAVRLAAPPWAPGVASTPKSRLEPGLL